MRPRLTLPASHQRKMSKPSKSPASTAAANTRRGALVCLLLLTFFALLDDARPSRARQADAQRPAAPPPAQVEEDDVLKIDTDLVLVDVSVTDARGRPALGLRAEDFKLYEDGVERPVAFVNVERRGGVERPVAVVFAVDVSGSMTGEEMARLRGAMRAFTERLEGRAALYALMSFGTTAKVHQELTSDPGKMRRAFERLGREDTGRSTHTYDAVDDAVRLLARKAPRTRDRRLMKRAVVVITDGFPVGDVVTPKTVIERANDAEVSVYTVTLPSYSRLLASAGDRAPLPTPLDVSGLAEKTGGSNVYADAKDYEPLFRALAEEVTSTYVLAFYPPEEKRRDGRFHNVRVEAPRGLFVRQNRAGYKSSDR